MTLPDPVPLALLQAQIERHQKPAPAPVPVTASGPPTGYAPRDEAAEIERALSVLPAHFGPNSYETWLRVLMAVHAALGNAGAALCDRYVPGHPGEVAAKFAGFDGHGVTVASLFDIAKRYGYRPTPLRPPHEELPELTPAEIAAILSGNPADALPFDLYEYRPEDGGILDAWIDHYADRWLYITGYDHWAYWQGNHWRPDRGHALDRELVRLVSAMNLAAETKLREAYALPDEEAKSAAKRAAAYITATKRNAGRVNSVMAMARGFRAAEAGQINGGNLLNLVNGTLDLDTLTLRDHDPADLLTYCLPYAYDAAATAPAWTTEYVPRVFVYEETNEFDPRLAALAQEVMGYSLTRDASLEVMIWLYGDGGNGKTVLIETLKALLGPMATSVDFQTIGLPGNYDLAKLPGMRVAFSTESERGGTVAEGYVKKISSGETISARPIYGTPFEFKATAKIWWAMNDKPVIRSTSTSMWRRLKMLPFYREFLPGEKDPTLTARLLQELPGILNWALEGLARLRANGGRFTESESAAAFLREYEDESNPVGQWLRERTMPASTPITPGRVLFADYQAWCKDTGRTTLNETNFGRELKRLRIPKRLSNGKRYALMIDRSGDITPDSPAEDVAAALGL